MERRFSHDRTAPRPEVRKEAKLGKRASPSSCWIAIPPDRALQGSTTSGRFDAVVINARKQAGGGGTLRGVRPRSQSPGSPVTVLATYPRPPIPPIDRLRRGAATSFTTSSSRPTRPPNPTWGMRGWVILRPLCRDLIGSGLLYRRYLRDHADALTIRRPAAGILGARQAR